MADTADLDIRFARPDEAGAITDLALRSKAVWGYDDEFMLAVRDELTIHPDDCDGEHLVVAERSGSLLGFYEITGTPRRGLLNSLFVEPSEIGTGLGGRLLDHARSRARELGFEILVIESDPFAEPFYLHKGAVRVGEVPSGSINGRELPALELAV